MVSVQPGCELSIEVTHPLFLFPAVTVCATAHQSVQQKDPQSTSNNLPNAFEPDFEYRYDVETRTVASLSDSDDRRYVGIVTQTELRLCLAAVDPDNRDHMQLIGQLIPRKSARIAQPMQDWRTDRVQNFKDDSNNNFCEKPFRIAYKKGNIHRMIVNKSCIGNVELNQLKGIMSQFQVNLRGANGQKLGPDRYTANNSSSKVFKRKEATVSGDCDTHYKVSWVPAQFLSRDWFPVPDSPVEQKNATFMKITKRKDYDKCERNLGFNYDAMANKNDMQEKHLGNRIGDHLVVSCGLIY